MSNSSNISYHGILSSFGLMSGVALVTTLFGIVSTKIIALYGGPESIGVFSLYQKLIGIVVPILAMGTITIIVQRISTATTEEHVAVIIKTVKYLLLVQIFLGLFVAIFLSEYISRWLFGDNYFQYMLSVKLVIIMAIIILIARIMISLINGKVQLKVVTFINLLMSFVTMIAAFFLIRYGDVGMALIVGSGSVVGGLVGFFYVRKIYFNEINLSVKVSKITEIFNEAPISIWLIAHPLFVSVALLNIQVLVGEYYGLESLGISANFR